MQTSSLRPAPSDVPVLAKRYLYWTGCAANYDGRIAAIVKATTKVMRSAGMEVVFLGDEEACTGDAVRRLGEEGLFQQLALRNIDTLKRHNVQHIVTHCAHCFHVLKNEYPRFGLEAKVHHHSQLIARLVRDGLLGLQQDPSQRATLHDSCYVGRYNRIFDEPRAILQAVNGVKTIEMPRHKEESFCCGAGGANYWYDAPKKEPVGVIRIREAMQTGAKTVVAECPFCIKMLEQAAQATAGAGGLRIKDIAEIVAEALIEQVQIKEEA